MGYDRADSFPFDIEPNGNQFGSKSKGKLSPRSYPIQFERNWNTSFLSVHMFVVVEEKMQSYKRLFLSQNLRMFVWQTSAILFLYKYNTTLGN